MTDRHLLSLVCLAIAALCWTGCGKPGNPAPAAAAPVDQLPSGLFVANVPGESVGPQAARQSARAGERVVLTGHIGGRAEPILAGRAVFILADLSLPACTDGCGTPWDLCCEAPEDILARTVTIQVVDGDGRPLKASLGGPGALAPGQKVVVAGLVQQADTQVFLVNAEQIAIQP